MPANFRATRLIRISLVGHLVEAMATAMAGDMAGATQDLHHPSLNRNTATLNPRSRLSPRMAATATSTDMELHTAKATPLMSKLSLKVSHSLNSMAIPMKATPAAIQEDILALMASHLPQAVGLTTSRAIMALKLLRLSQEHPAVGYAHSCESLC